MLPTFGNERKRKINLGGVPSTITPSDILDQALNRRHQRASQKRQFESAIKIQAWYRGIREARHARMAIRRMFEEDVVGITGLRCLVLMGTRGDEEVLGNWAGAMADLGPGQIYALSSGAHRESWLVLIRKTSLILLCQLADKPNSPNAFSYLQVLKSLLSKEIATNTAGANGAVACCAITAYLLAHNQYALLSKSLKNTPKSSPNLPLLLNLITSPLSTFNTATEEYGYAFAYLVSHILTIPLLPNRLPLTHVSAFTAQLPIQRLHIVDPHLSRILKSAAGEDRIHLAANLYMFVSPNYKLLEPAALATYLQLSVPLINSFPIFKSDLSGKNLGKAIGGDTRSAWGQHGYESDEDEEHGTRISVVDSFISSTPPPPPVEIDDKTRKRLEKIASAPHLASLISATKGRPALLKHLLSYLFALTAAWTTLRGEILNIILASAGGGFMKDVYRSLIRGSVLGREDSPGSLMDPQYDTQWMPILFLVDLYSQALLTMGDDEFFGIATGGTSVRNPLSLDELISFSKQLLNIAFTLYLRDDQTAMKEVNVSADARCTWQGAREKVTNCLVGIHARDSRKPFVPPDHWLAMNQLDMNSFVEAALLEEQQLSKPDSQLPRFLSKSQIAAMSPRLGILNNIPFAVPFEVRVSIFRHFVMNDATAHGSRHGGRFRNEFFMHERKARVQVRRGMVAQDGFDKLGEVDLKAPIEISFIDQFGQEEAGIDGGGVFKEFFTSLCKEVFDTDRGLWLANKKNELYPNPHAYATEAHSLNWYRFVGRILGKAMYEGILVDVAFASFFLAKWLGKQSFLDDLASLDPDLYNGLIFLKHYSGNPEDLSLNFTIAADEFGVTRTIDLMPNGSNIAVTRENRLAYIYLVSHYRLTKQIKKQSDAFFEGLSEMIDPKWLRMFNQQEVQILIGGVNSPIDLDDLRRNTNYGGLYDDNHDTIAAFWRVVNAFDQEQRRSLLRFVTSCSRPPLLGFKELVPNFSIRDAGSDQYRLPTSSTCVNLLKLPLYTTDRQLRDKLLQAINSGAGFDLS